eukprot:COSAG05_NODE_3543_length_2000_cov_2.430300_2_plen_191_part_00
MRAWPIIYARTRMCAAVKCVYGTHVGVTDSPVSMRRVLCSDTAAPSWPHQRCRLSCRGGPPTRKQNHRRCRRPSFCRWQQRRRRLRRAHSIHQILECGVGRAPNAAAASRLGRDARCRRFHLLPERRDADYAVGPADRRAGGAGAGGRSSVSTAAPEVAGRLARPESVTAAATAGHRAASIQRWWWSWRQ